MSKIKMGIKMRVTPEQSKKVQEICFVNSIAWLKSTEIKHLDKPFIYINLSKYLGYSDDYKYFDEDDNEEVSAELFIKTNGSCIESETLTESITSEEPQPKTFSEYLKKNNAYESFVENCVEVFLKDLAWYKVFKSKNKIISLSKIFIWEDTKEGQKYWHNLNMYKPENLVDDMNEIIFAEVDKRIVEQKSSTKYMVFVEGRSNPKKIHDSYDSAEKEARRLSAKEIGCNVFVVSVVTTFKSKVIVEEIK